MRKAQKFGKRVVLLRAKPPFHNVGPPAGSGGWGLTRDRALKPELDQLSNHSGFVVMKKPAIRAVEFAHGAIASPSWTAGLTGDNVVTSVTFSSTTVPEPSTWALMLLGFAGLGYAGCRSTRKSGAL